MSARQFFGALATNLIVAGVVGYLKGPHAGLVLLSIGFLLLIAIYLVRKRSQPQAPSPRQVTQTVRQEANPQVILNIGKGVLDGEDKRSGGPPAEPPKPEPNIRFVESKNIGVHRGLEDRQIYESPQGLGDFQVSVVCFRNEAMVGQSVHQPSLKAQIIYKNKSGDEFTDSPRAVCLEHYGESVRFEVGKKKCLIVFLLSNQGTLKKLWNESYRSRHRWMAGGGQVFQIRDEAISDEVSSVDVNLLSENKNVLRASFDVKQRGSGQLPSLVFSSVATAGPPSRISFG